MLDIIVENQAGRIRVQLTGRLDTDTYASCSERLRPLLTPSTRVLVLDLAGVSFLSSMGLRVLMQTTKTMAAHGGKCLLARPQTPVRKVIEIANALPRETIFESIEEADRYFTVIQQRAREEEAGK